MTDIVANLRLVESRISAACESAGRERASVALLAVSKTKPLDMVEAAANSGQIHFGENYLQDALAKITMTKCGAIQWHFIGAIQSNKTRAIAEHFDWVHTISSMKVAKRLNAQRPDNMPPLNVLLQVNVDDDPAKAGLRPDQLEEMTLGIQELERLQLKGLMTLPQQRLDLDGQRAPFARLKQLQTTYCPDCPDLSMGMSGDLEAAIQEGATWVRIGTDIFGARSEV